VSVYRPAHIAIFFTQSSKPEGQAKFPFEPLFLSYSCIRS